MTQKSTNLDDLEGPHCTNTALLHQSCVFQSSPRKSEKMTHNISIKNDAQWLFNFKWYPYKVVYIRGSFVAVGPQTTMPNFISIRSGVLILLGSNFWLSHRKEKSLLTHGLNYRLACDLLVVYFAWVFLNVDSMVYIAVQVQLWSEFASSNSNMFVFQTQTCLCSAAHAATAAPPDLVIPKTPNLVAKSRTRRVTAKSHADAEQEEVEEMKK